MQGKVVARGSDSGDGRRREIPRGRLWYLMQLDQQGRRITTGAGATIVPSSSSFRKLASLLFLVEGFFPVSGLPVSYWSRWVPYLHSLLGSCSFSLTSRWVQPMGANRRLEVGGEKVTVFNPCGLPERRTQASYALQSLSGQPSHLYFPPPWFQYSLPSPSIRT